MGKWGRGHGHNSLNFRQRTANTQRHAVPIVHCKTAKEELLAKEMGLSVLAACD
jgi:hypothetical protein